MPDHSFLEENWEHIAIQLSSFLFHIQYTRFPQALLGNWPAPCFDTTGASNTECNFVQWHCRGFEVHPGLSAVPRFNSAGQNQHLV